VQHLDSLAIGPQQDDFAGSSPSQRSRESDPRTASRSVTYLTLIGGFASTIFLPISAALNGYLSWREIYRKRAFPCALTRAL